MPYENTSIGGKRAILLDMVRSTAAGIAELVQSKREEILRIAEANGATRVRVFGSVARGTAGPDSDLDLLIRLEPDRSLFDLVAIKLDIEDLLGRQVHVVTEGGIDSSMRDAILRDAVPL